MPDDTALTLPLDAIEATIDNAGGKGANLARMSQAGFPVPPGFLITTTAYRASVNANKLQPHILKLARSVETDNPDALEETSHTIRNLFEQGQIPEDVADAIRTAYRDLSQLNNNSQLSIENSQFTISVAVRSSATAEDLPEASFAGQQDTYLNIVGDEALLDAVRRCWGSLWTARAIGYRARNDILPDDVALAVVVQAMAPATASGVLFTADPVTEYRHRTVIDATLGLGEALVSGQVEPDHYVYDRRSGAIVERRLGEKAIAIRSTAGGGTETTEENTSSIQALPDEVIRKLAQMGQAVEELFAAPQDIEWAWNGEHVRGGAKEQRARGNIDLPPPHPRLLSSEEGLHLLQSRPITNLFPLAEPAPDHFAVYFSLAAVQGMLAPFTPLGADVFRRVLTGAIDGITPPARRDPESQPTKLAAGRIFIDITSALAGPRSRRVLLGVAGLIEPAMLPAFRQLADDARLAPRTTLDSTQVKHLAGGIASLLPRIARTVRNPDRARTQILRWIDGYLADTRHRITAAPDLATFAQVTEQTAARALRDLAHDMLAHVVVGVDAMMLARILSRRWLDDESAGLELTRGLLHNPTTEMDLELWRLAERIRDDRASYNIVVSQPPAVLETAFQQGILPAPAQEGMSAFLERYGSRGVAEIDIGRPRWRNQPAPLFEALQGYLRLEDPSQSPEAVFRRSAQSAEEMLRELQSRLREQPLGELKARILEFIYKRLRALAGLREMPKFTAIRTMGLLRQRLLDEGDKLVEAGVLETPDDVFFADLSRLKAYAEGNLEARALREIIAANRERYQQELRRSRVPRVITSDGDAFYEGIVDETGDARGGRLVGSAVSPGVVEGPVRVVLNPQNAGLQPGEVLVCPATDPGWTPLFLTAAGLIMEMGGMMTHGSIVAREYGLPAVVGVNNATKRLSTGQRVRVDGTNGRVTIIASPGSQPLEPGYRRLNLA